MASITSLGIGSGIDINSMVSQLVALERRPLDQMRSDASRMQTQVSSLGRLQSLFSALQDASSKLTGTSLWQASTAASSNNDAVTTVGSSSAAAGNYAVTVQSLAAGQTLSSSTTFGAATDLAGSGTLTIELGAWDATRSAFTPKAGAIALSLNVSAADTVQTLRDKINAAGAGVTASLVTDANGVRLALRSTETGAVNGFRIQAADGDGNNADNAGLSRFAFDPPNAANGMEFKQAANNARATVNGIAVEGTTNDLSGVVDGLTLRLRQVVSSPVDVAVTSDREAIGKAIRAFADAYNSLATTITEQTRYDATSRIGGVLQGDSTVNGLTSRLRAAVNTPTGASSTLSRLSDLGLEMTREGTLNVNGTKLDSAMRDLPALRTALANSDAGNSANDGLARRFSSLATAVLGVDGSITTRTEGLRTQITRNSESQQRLETRVERFRERLVAQYTAMDANLSKLNALSSYVTQQVNAFNRTPSN